MNCPHCDTHIDEHEALPCLNMWIAEIVFEQEECPIHLSHICCGRHKGAYSTDTSAAKQASDKAGSAVIFAPNSAVRDGSYANRKNDWLVEMIPYGKTTEYAIWAYGETEELARCRAAIKVTIND